MVVDDVNEGGACELDEEEAPAAVDEVVDVPRAAVVVGGEGAMEVGAIKLLKASLEELVEGPGSWLRLEEMVLLILWYLLSSCCL